MFFPLVLNALAMGSISSAAGIGMALSKFHFLKMEIWFNLLPHTKVHCFLYVSLICCLFRVLPFLFLDIVSCLALDQDILVTGSLDTTVMVWQVSEKLVDSFVNDKPKHVLYGHDDEVVIDHCFL